MNTFKTNKGITLVALIITIIVLLILTVVAISSITDQGLFTKSQEAVNSYEDSRKAEEGKLAGYASEIDKYLNPKEDKVYTFYGDGGYIISITLKSDNQAIVRIGSEEPIVYTYEYCDVTQEMLTENGIEDAEAFFAVCSTRVIIAKDADGNSNIVPLSKDETIIYFGDAPCALEREKTYPIAYGISDTVTLIEISNNEVIDLSTGEMVKRQKIKCSDIRDLKTEYKNINITNLTDYGYTEVMLREDGAPMAVYLKSLDAWAGVIPENLNNGFSGYRIYDENHSVRINNMTTEQINSYINGQ